jgi:hypothetical protein
VRTKSRGHKRTANTNVSQRCFELFILSNCFWAQRKLNLQLFDQLNRLNYSRALNARLAASYMAPDPQASATECVRALISLTDFFQFPLLATVAWKPIKFNHIQKGNNFVNFTSCAYVRVPQRALSPTLFINAKGQRDELIKLDCIRRLCANRETNPYAFSNGARPLICCSCSKVAAHTGIIAAFVRNS